METKSCLKDSATADPSSQASRKDRRVSFFEKAHVRPVPRKVSSSFREGIFTVPDLSSDRRGSSGNTFGLSLDKYESSFSSQDSFYVPLDPRSREAEDSFASPTVSDIESMHQSFADILASPSRNLKEAEISFEAITGTKLSTLEGEENSGDECNESSSSQPVGNEGSNISRSVDMDFTQCTGGIAGNVILSAYEAGVLDGLEKQADDMTMDITDCTGGIQSIVPQAIKDALLKSLKSERRKSLSASRPSMGAGEMDMTVCVGGIVSAAPKTGRNGSADHSPEISFHSAKAGLTPRGTEKREQSPFSTVDSPSKRQKITLENIANGQANSVQCNSSSSKVKLSQSSLPATPSPRRSSRLSSSSSQSSSPVDISPVHRKLGSRTATPKKAIPVDGVILSPRVEVLRRTGSARKRSNSSRSSLAASSSIATSTESKTPRKSDSLPQSLGESPTFFEAKDDVTAAVMCEINECEEEFVQNESFIGESYPPSEVNDNSLLIESPRSSPLPSSVDIGGLCKDANVTFENFSLPLFHLESADADASASLETEAIEELDFWVQKNQLLVDSMEKEIEQSLQTLILAYGDDETSCVERFKRMMVIANEMAENESSESWFEWIFNLHQPYAQAIFVRLQVLEKDVLSLQEIEKDIEAAAAPIIEQGQSIEAKLAEAKNRAALFDPKDIQGLEDTESSIKRMDEEMKSAVQNSADIDTEFSRLEEQYRELIDIQQELNEKKEIAGKEALVLESEVANDDKSDSIVVQQKKAEYDLWTKLFLWDLRQVEVDQALILDYRDQLTIRFNPRTNEIAILTDACLAKPFTAMLRESLRSPGFHSISDLKKFGFAVEIVADVYRRFLEPLEKKAPVKINQMADGGLLFQTQLPSGKQGNLMMSGLAHFVDSTEFNL